MSEQIKIKLEHTLHTLDVILCNQKLIRNDQIEDELLILFKRLSEERKIAKQLEYQLKSVMLKTKSQSQQIQVQRQRRLVQSSRAEHFHKTLVHIHEMINYHSQHTSPIDQLHYIKKICEDRLREDKSLSDDDDDEIDSHNCTIDEDPTESHFPPPRVVLPQSSSRKRLINEKNNLLTRNIQIIDSTSSMEQTLPDTTKVSVRMPIVVTHRFISKKIFRPETCFVCLKRIHFGSISYRCSLCSQSTHVNCKENCNTHCPSTSHHEEFLSITSPKTPIISKLKVNHRQRMINSEPRKSSSTVQRRLPFERILLLKK